MKKLIILAVLIFATTTGTAELPDPVEWKLEDGGNGHLYLAVTWTKTDWTNAQLYANTIYRGYLVTITSQEEQDFINDYLTSISPPADRYWIGLREKYFEGYWEWITGEEMVFYNWRSNQPDDAGDREDHVELAWGNVPSDTWYNERGKWNDMEHVHKNYFIVEIEPHDVCGDFNHPYPLGDLNKDCRVDLIDLAMMAANWLKCTAPECD